MIKVLVNGAKGKVGREIVRTIGEQRDLKLVGETSKGDNLSTAIKAASADVVIEFTRADVGYENVSTILTAGARPVVGTSGFDEATVKKLQALAGEQRLGGVIAPNFSISAVLMMKFAAEAAKFMPNVEIVELHHDKKADSPSGTAVRTAEMIAASRDSSQVRAIPQDGRGKAIAGIITHSVRLPGLLAHQEVLFGGTGESLAIRSDCINRECFLDGIFLACREVMKTDQLYYGLEHFLK